MTSEDGKPTREQNVVLCIILLVDAVMYLALIVLCCHNLWNYLYKQQLWKSYYMSMFYLMTTVILSCRFLMCINYFLFDANLQLRFPPNDPMGDLWGYQFDMLSSFLKICLGWFQCASVVEYVIVLRQEDAFYYGRRFSV